MISLAKNKHTKTEDLVQNSIIRENLSKMFSHRSKKRNRSNPKKFQYISYLCLTLSLITNLKYLKISLKQWVDIWLNIETKDQILEIEVFNFLYLQIDFLILFHNLNKDDFIEIFSSGVLGFWYFGLWNYY